jgi:PKD repeat protein
VVLKHRTPHTAHRTPHTAHRTPHTARWSYRTKDLITGNLARLKTIVLITILTGLFGNYLQAQSPPSGLWCDDCPVLTQNINLELDPNINYPVPSWWPAVSFQVDMVPFWGATHSSPHHTQYIPSVSCSNTWTSPNGTERNCLAVSGNFFSEGVFQNVANLTTDNYVTYCMNMTAQRLICNWQSTNFHLNIAIGREFINNPVANQSGPLPANPRQDLAQIEIVGNDPIPISFDFQPNQNTSFDQLVIYTSGINSIGSGFVELRDVRLRCRTAALVGINIAELVQNQYRFSAENASEQSHFVSYHWDFGDGNTSTDPTPVHQYAGGGTYQVCLNVIDNNGCCGSFCTTIETSSLPLCVNGDDEYIIINAPEGGNGNVNLSDLISQGILVPTGGTTSSPSFTGMKIYLNANLILDRNADFTDVDWLIEGDKYINVVNSWSLSLNDCELNGCEYMWEGIRLNDNSSTRIWLRNTTIRDAKKAVDVLLPAALNIRDSYFENNIHAIDIRNNSANAIPMPLGGLPYIWDSEFKTTQALKPQLTGVYNESIGLYGVRLNKIANFQLRQCLFEDLRYGVFSSNTSLQLNNNNFVGTTDISSSHKTGVYVLGAGPLTRVQSNNSFTNLTRGVVFVGYNRISEFLVSFSNFVHNSSCGIYPQSFQMNHLNISAASSSKIDINHVNFNLSSVGTSIVLSGNVNELEARFSNFTNNYWGCPNHAVSIQRSTSGIKRFRHNRFDVNFTPNNNKITYTVQGLNSENMRFFNNRSNFLNFYGDAAASNYTDYLLQNTNNSLFGNNIFNDQQKAFSGFYAGQSAKNTYCCNNSQYPGFSYSYRDESFSDIIGNDLSGLHLSSTGLIGPQINNNNFWRGSQSTARMDDGTPERGGLNEFVVDPNQPDHKPLSILPSIIEDDWFSTVGMSFYDCRSQCTEEALDTTKVNQNPPGGPQVPDVDECEKACELYAAILEMLADSTLAYGDQRLWQAWSQLYRACGNQVFSTTFCDTDTLPPVDPVLPDWVDVEDDITNVDVPDDDVFTDGEPLIQQLEVLYDQYNDLVENADPVNPGNDLINCSNSIVAITIQLDSLSDVGTQQVVTKANQLLAQVNNLPTPYPFLAYRKEVWKLHLKLIISGEESITPSELNYLKDVSELCPSEMGPVVYEAMSLVQSLGEVVDYDPYDECNYDLLKNRGKLNSLSTDETLALYPNPSDGIVYIESEGLKSGTVITITNALGHLVHREALRGDTHNYRLDLMNVPGGLYYYTVDNQEGMIHTGKLIIIK